MTTAYKRPIAANANMTPEDQVMSVLVQAFETDPPVRWMYPDTEIYRAHFPDFVRALGGAALRDKTLCSTEAAAALWMQPGAESDEEALVSIVETTVEPHRQADLLAVFEQMGAHHPHEPHWYLPLVGVLPGQQGRGFGSAMMRPVLNICDATGTAAYLEATTERSRQLYERFGFVTTAEICVADCPTIYPMLRPAQNRA